MVTAGFAYRIIVERFAIDQGWAADLGMLWRDIVSILKMIY